MNDATCIETLKRGVDVWNQWRAAERAVTPNFGSDLTYFREANLDGIDLSGADLSNAQLQGVRLRHANLCNANLLNADLSGAELCACQLCGADLKFARFDQATLADSDMSGADLTGASLCEVDLGTTKLNGATFRAAILQKTNLEVSRGLLHAEDFAGADLTGAKLPESLKKFYEELKAVGEISTSAKRLFITMLAACLYCWLTITTTTDLNLITNRTSSPLPIIQTSIPIVGFYVVAPLLLVSIYFYFHFYLQRLWEELGSLPAIFADGQRLHNRLDPWLLNDLVRSNVALLKSGRPFMSYLQQAISIMLTWWLVPFTLFLFWGRYLRRHDFRWTYLQVFLLAAAVTAGFVLYRLAISSLQGWQRRPFRPWKNHLKSRRFYAGVLTFLGTGAAFIVVSIGAIRGVDPDQGVNNGFWTWTPRMIALFGYSPFANLLHEDISVKPSNWTDKSDLGGVKGAELEAADLGYMEASGAFLAKADLSGARLKGADLSESDLQNATFVKFDPYSRNTFFGIADLTDANLSEADLRGADLRIGHLRGAYMMNADLTGAFLNSADLDGATLEDANLQFADFRSLPSEATFGARVETRGLNADQVKLAKHWTEAYFDDDMIKELCLAPDHNARVEKERQKEPAERSPDTCADDK